MHPDFVTAYNQRRGTRSLTIEEFRQRFIDRQEWDGDCLVWQGAFNGKGYGSLGLCGKTMLAHRVAYWMATGQEPPKRASGLELDHLCRNRACVNPDHLELVTQTVNILRGESPTALNAVKTHCIHGHEFTTENTRYTKKGRDCRACHRKRMRKTMARLRAAALAGGDSE